jgi:hypothetical protein
MDLKPRKIEKWHVQTPYLHCRLNELRKLFAGSQTDPVRLALLDDELSYRKRSEAGRIRYQPTRASAAAW